MRESLARIAALSWNAHRQALRDKVLYVLGGFAAALLLASLVVSEMTVGERGRIVMDLGLSATSLLTVLVAVVVPVNQLAREIERRGLDFVLSKPVARWEFLAGRFLGIGLTLGFMVLAMGLLHALVLACVGAASTSQVQALLLTWIEALVVAAEALFVSTFATTMPALFVTLALVVIGHTSWGLVLMASHVGSTWARWLLHVLYVALPNLELLNVRAQVVWDTPVPWEHVARAAAYGLGWCGLLVVAGAALLSRRDIK